MADAAARNARSVEEALDGFCVLEDASDLVSRALVERGESSGLRKSQEPGSLVTTVLRSLDTFS